MKIEFTIDSFINGTWSVITFSEVNITTNSSLDTLQNLKLKLAISEDGKYLLFLNNSEAVRLVTTINYAMEKINDTTR